MPPDDLAATVCAPLRYITIFHTSPSPTRSSYQKDKRDKPWNLKKRQRSLGNRTSFPIAVGVFSEQVYDFSCPVQVSKAELPIASLRAHSSKQSALRTHTDTIRFPVSCCTHSGCYMRQLHLHRHPNTLLLSTQRSDVLRTAPSSQPTAITALEMVRLRNVKCLLRGTN